MESWWCLKDAFCLALVSGVGVSALSGCRRLERCRTTRAIWQQVIGLLAHSGVCGACATGMSLLGSELYPGHPGLVLGLVLVTAGAIDLGSDKGRAWLLKLASGLWRSVRIGAQAVLTEWAKSRGTDDHDEGGDEK